MACWQAVEHGVYVVHVTRVTKVVDRVYVNSCHTSYVRWSAAYRSVYRFCVNDMWRAITGFAS